MVSNKDVIYKLIGFIDFMPPKFQRWDTIGHFRAFIVSDDSYIVYDDLKDEPFTVPCETSVSQICFSFEVCFNP